MLQSGIQTGSQRSNRERFIQHPLLCQLLQRDSAPCSGSVGARSAAQQAVAHRRHTTVCAVAPCNVGGTQPKSKGGIDAALTLMRSPHDSVVAQPIKQRKTKQSISAALTLMRSVARPRPGSRPRCKGRGGSWCGRLLDDAWLMGGLQNIMGAQVLQTVLHGRLCPQKRQAGGPLCKPAISSAPS